MNQLLIKVITSRNSISIWLALIFLASLFSIENLGGRSGIYAPYNVTVYFVVTSFVLFTMLRLFVVKRIYISKWAVINAVMILLLMFVGLVNTQKTPEFYYPTFIAGFSAILFFFGLFQYRITPRQWRVLFLFICIVGFLQVLISLVQRFDDYNLWYFWTNYFPFEFHGRYLGSLQQVNMLPTFVAFTVVLSLYLISFKAVQLYSPYLKIFGFLFVLSAVFIVFSSGSRAGVLTLVIGSTLLFWGRKKQLFKQSNYFATWLVLFIGGMILSLLFPGELSTLDKFGNVIGGADNRLYLYKTAWALFMEQPLFGFGLGGFTDAFVNYASVNGIPDYFQEDIRSFTHPHNELLFWMDQSGVIALLVLPTFGVWYLVNLIKQGWAKMLTVVGLLAPFLIESQLSYPFSLSAIHFFTLFLLLYFGVQEQKKFYHVALKPMAIVSSASVVVMIWFASFYATYISVKSIFESYYFYNRYFLYKHYPEQEKQGYYKYATHHPSYLRYVKNDMQILLNQALIDNNHYDLNQYLLWSQSLDLTNERNADVLENTRKIHEFLNDES